MKYINRLLILYPVMVIFFLVFGFVVDPKVNYGISFNVHLYVFPFLAVFAAFGYIVSKYRSLLIALAVNLLCIPFFFCVDYFNIMVDEETWIERGMPYPFSREPQRSIIGTKEEYTLRILQRKREERIKRREDGLKECDLTGNLVVCFFASADVSIKDIGHKAEVEKALEDAKKLSILELKNARYSYSGLVSDVKTFGQIINDNFTQRMHDTKILVNPEDDKFYEALAKPESAPALERALTDVYEFNSFER